MERDQQKVTAASIERVQYIVKGDWLLQAACVCVCVSACFCCCCCCSILFLYSGLLLIYHLYIFAIDLPSIYLFYMFLVEGT